MTNEIFNYNGQNITFQLGNGDVMVNATEMAKAFGKTSKDYLRTQSAKALVDAVAGRHNCHPTDIVKVVNGGDSFGTWMHEDIALDFAQWLSVDFKLWCNDRIKELLTTGHTSLPNFNNPAEAARAWADQYEKRELAEQQVKELEPKGEVYDRISNAVNLLTMAEAAKAVGVGRNKLFKTLREKKVLRHNNTPYQQYIDNGVFQVKVRPINRGSSVENYAQTLVTGKGLSKLSNILTK